VKKYFNKLIITNEAEETEVFPDEENFITGRRSKEELDQLIKEINISVEQEEEYILSDDYTSSYMSFPPEENFYSCDIDYELMNQITEASKGYITETTEACALLWELTDAVRSEIFDCYSNGNTENEVIFGSYIFGEHEYAIPEEIAKRLRSLADQDKDYVVHHTNVYIDLYNIRTFGGSRDLYGCINMEDSGVYFYISAKKALKLIKNHFKDEISKIEKIENKANEELPDEKHWTME
jgi:hypothetical protein